MLWMVGREGDVVNGEKGRGCCGWWGRGML